MLVEVSFDECPNCGFAEFDDKAVPAVQPEEYEPLTLSALPAERRGAMVFLKCRTPGEACLVRENLEAADVIALAPDPQEMFRQYRKNGYVEVQIPANAYDSTGELRTALEFSTFSRAKLDRAACGLTMVQKVFAAFLGIVIVPGLLVFNWLLIRYRESGQDKKANEFKLWFLVGAGSWVLLFLVCLILGK